MSWRTWMTGAVLLLATSAPAATIARATWLWNNSVVDSAARRDDVLRFCGDRRIDTIFLYAPADHLQDRAAEFRAFLAAAHARRMQVEALGGESGWVWEREKLSAFLAAVRAFNDAGKSDERFDGVHLDIEPYDTPQWKQDPDTGGKAYLETLEAARAEAGDMKLAADVPPWFGEIATPEGTLLSGAIERVDEVGLMAYTDQTKGLVAEVEPAIAFAAQQKKRVWIGVSAQAYDTDMNPGAALKPQVERVVKRAEKLFQGSPGLRGVAIHDYEHLRALYDRRRTR